MASEYPEKYGIIKSDTITNKHGNGMSVCLNLIEGQPAISGILIEKIN